MKRPELDHRMTEAGLAGGAAVTTGPGPKWLQPVHIDRLLLATM